MSRLPTADRPSPRLPGGFDGDHMGCVAALIVRPRQGEPCRAATSLVFRADHGIEGDYTAEANEPGNDRQVTLIQSEHLAAVAALLGRKAIDPRSLRRNMVITGINLLALLHVRAAQRPLLHIGSDVVLDVSEACEPCGLMELELGRGGLNAMQGHGGVCARVVRGGVVQLGDAVAVCARATVYPWSPRSAAQRTAGRASGA